MKTDLPTLGPLLHDATRLIRRRFEQHTADLGLSSAQWRLLIIVLKTENVTQARLAERLEIEPISVSRLIDRMEQAGWVAREPDPQDRRVRQIVATQKALDIKERLYASARDVYAEALVGLSPEAAETLNSHLSLIIENLSQATSLKTACSAKESS